jgi:hypothetical protein
MEENILTGLLFAFVFIVQSALPPPPVWSPPTRLPAEARTVLDKSTPITKKLLLKWA